DLRLGRRVDRLQLTVAQAIDLAAVAGAEEAIAIRRIRLRQHERIGEGRNLLQLRRRPQLPARRNRESIDVAGEKVVERMDAPELGGDGEGVGCKERD